MIYSKEFINSLCSYCLTARLTCEYRSGVTFQKEIKDILAEVGEKFFFEMIPHASTTELYSLGTGSETIGKILNENPQASKNLLSKILKRPDEFINIFVKCPEERVRQCIGKIILSAFTCVATYENSQPDSKEQLSLQFLNLFIGLIGYDLAVQWTKFKQFFETLKDMIISGGELILQRCFEKDLVLILLDFFLEKQSPLFTPSIKRYDMGSQGFPPEFGPLIELIGFLISKTKKLTQNENKEQESLTLPKPEEKFYDIKSYSLSADALKCIQCDAFIVKLLLFGGKIDFLSKLLASMCFDNKKLTKRMCKHLIKVINEFDICKIGKYLSFLGELLIIPDKFQELRLEWILGYQQPKDQPQYGLAGQYDIGYDVNVYITPIGLELRDDPLLMQLWRYRKRDETLTAQFLKLLLQMMEKNEKLYTYIKNIPAPSYLFARYTDWIPSFIFSYEHGGMFLTTLEKKERETLSAEVKKLFEAYSKRLAEENCKIPQKYMVGKTLSVNEKIIQENKGLSILITEYETEIYDSTPMGDQNTALESSYLVE